MKKLSIEEKAKAYDDALKQIKECTPDENGFITIYPQEIFPGLKESEDEKIRKALIKYFKNCVSLEGINGEDISNWLEKQGEQKSTDKLEPKFKPGDWITDGSITIQIEEIKNNCYLYCGDCYLYSTKNADKVYHLWTIQDAKDGDVLADDVGVILYRKIGNEMYPDVVDYHCVCVSRSERFEIQKEVAYWGRLEDTKLYPATKEQRDLLFQKMKEAGYEWDANKKELKKIEQKPTNNQFTPEQADVLDKHIDQYLEQKQDASIQINNPSINDTGGNGCYLKNTVQSTTWSDVDSYMLGEAIKCVNNSGKLEISTEEIEDWLKSLKGRVQPQQKQEWSKADEHRCENCLYAIRETFKGVDNPHRVGTIDWLKSLKDRVQPKQEWSEEDERIYKSIAYSFAHNYPLTVQQQEFVKSFKNRVGCETNYATTNEWSAEDKRNLLDVKCIIDEIWHNQNVREEIDHSSEELELLWHWLDNIWKRVGYPQSQWQPSDEELAQAKKDAYNEVLDKIEYDSENPTFDDGWSAAIDYIRKKSLTPQITWLPSDEQMKGIECTIKTLKYQLNAGDERLNSLYQDLKKLREK